jgi:hypothetical protein
LTLEHHHVVVLEIVLVDDPWPVPPQHHLATVIGDLHPLVAAALATARNEGSRDVPELGLTAMGLRWQSRCMYPAQHHWLQRLHSMIQG